MTIDMEVVKVVNGWYYYHQHQQLQHQLQQLQRLHHHHHPAFPTMSLEQLSWHHSAAKKRRVDTSSTYQKRKEEQKVKPTPKQTSQPVVQPPSSPASSGASTTCSTTSGADTYGMLLRNGKRGVIFKPYSDSLLKSRRRRKMGSESKFVRGCKRKYDEANRSQDDFEDFETLMLTKDPAGDLDREQEQVLEGQKTTTIGSLLPEVLTMIFEKLDVQSRGRAAQVCKSWRDACYRKSCWKGVEARLHIGKTNPPLYQSLQKRGIKKVQVLSLKRTIREMMTNIPKLEQLNLSGCYNFTDMVVESCFHKREFLHLKVLDLSLCKEIHDHSIALMTKKCPNIEELDLAGCNYFSNLGLREVARNLKKLRKLNLRSCRQITDVGIGYLANYSMSGEEVEEVPADQEEVRKGSMIEDLSLQDCQKLTDESLNILSQECFQLTKLNLSFCVSVTDTGLKSLAKVRTLKSLNLRSCDNVSDIGISFLAERNCRLSELDVSFCANVTNTSLFHISSGFPMLKSLAMTTCSITDQGLKRMAKKLTEIEKLNIGQCTAITDEGLKSLSENLKKIKFLDVYGCPKISSKVIEDIRANLPNLERVNREL